MNNIVLFPDASNYIITNIDKLATYARTLAQYHHITQDQQRLFAESSDHLQNVRNKWQNGLGRCLLKSDVKVLYDFAGLLVEKSINQYFISDSIYDRMIKFWSYIKEIPDDRVSEVIIDQSTVGLDLFPSGFAKISGARESTNLMINAVIDRNYSKSNHLLILDIPTILLTIVIRSEAHEYTIGRILQKTEMIIKNQIDIPDLLSVIRKEPKEDQFKPDTRAIRDATAHAKFIIKNDPSGDFIIDFNNTELGYSFQNTFSRKQLLQFYQDYDRMTTIYTQLLSIRLLSSFLNLNFIET
jgi:hypothetical protein